MALFSLHLPVNAHEGDMEKKSTEEIEEGRAEGAFSTSRSNKRPHRKEEEEEEEEEEGEMKASSLTSSTRVTAPPSSNVSAGLRPSIPRLPPGFTPKSGQISELGGFRREPESRFSHRGPTSSGEFQERPRPEGEEGEGEARGSWETATPNLAGGGDGSAGGSSECYQRKWGEKPSKTASRVKSSIWSRNNCCWKVSDSSSNSPEARHSDEAEEVVVGPTFRKGRTLVQETWEPSIESDDGEDDDDAHVAAMEGSSNPLKKGVEIVQSVGKI